MYTFFYRSTSLARYLDSQPHATSVFFFHQKEGKALVPALWLMHTTIFHMSNWFITLFFRASFLRGKGEAYVRASKRQEDSFVLKDLGTYQLWKHTMVSKTNQSCIYQWRSSFWLPGRCGLWGTIRLRSFSPDPAGNATHSLSSHVDQPGWVLIPSHHQPCGSVRASPTVSPTRPPAALFFHPDGVIRSSRAPGSSFSSRIGP
jgi:hypothetical protein